MWHQFWKRNRVSVQYHMYFWISHDKVICMFSAVIIVKRYSCYSSIHSLWKVPWGMGSCKENHSFVWTLFGRDVIKYWYPFSPLLFTDNMYRYKINHWCINKYRCVRKGRDECNLLFIQGCYSYKKFWYVVKSYRYSKSMTLWLICSIISFCFISVDSWSLKK